MIMVSAPPSGSRTSCPWPFNLLLLPFTASMGREKGVTINACVSPGKSGKSRPPPVIVESSKLDPPMKNVLPAEDDEDSSGESDESGDCTTGSSNYSFEQKLTPDLQACSAVTTADREQGTTLSSMFCATGPGGRGGGEASKKKDSCHNHHSGGNNQFNADFFEKALSAGGKESSRHHFPFVFSASDCLRSLAALNMSQKPLSAGNDNNIIGKGGAGSNGDNNSLVVGIEEPSSNVINIRANSNDMNQLESRHRRERRKDVILVESDRPQKEQQPQQHLQQQQQQPQPQPQPQPALRRPKSFQRRKSSGASSSASSLSGRFSVASIAPRWSLDSSASKGGGISSQSATPASLPPKAKRKSGGGSSSNSIGGIRKSSMPTPRRAVIKSADMSEEMQQDALACAVRAMDEFDLDTDIAAYIKKEFDKKHGAKWHCVVGKNFGSFVTHETRGFIYLYRGQVAVLLFKAG